MALIGERLGLQAGELIHAANVDYPRSNVARPGFVGGPCLEKDALILIDFGSRVDDYNSDITRMYMFGRANDEQLAMYRVVRDAQEQAVAATRAGASGRGIHELTARVIDGSPFKGRFIHGTGHSIGLEVHDGPGLGAASELTLAPNMIMTVEPGVYVPGVGGVRIDPSTPNWRWGEARQDVTLA